MRTIRPLLAVIAIAWLAAACGSSASAPLDTVGNAVGQPAGAGGGSTGGAGGVPVANPVPAPGSTAGPVAAVDDTKIIRTGSMTLEVSDLAKALTTARDAIVGFGGYVGASTTSNGSSKPSAEIAYRIPADKWEPALDALRGLNGLTDKVVAEHTEAVEVTGQVVDLQANIANLQASEIALQGIAEKATKISDVLEVQAQLTATRGQIQTLAAQLKDLNDRSAYATLTVDFNVPVVAVEVAAKGWEPATVVDEAAASMVSILQNFATAGIWFVIVWLPILIVLGVVTTVVVWIGRRLGLGRSRADVMPPPAAPLAGEG